MPIERDQKIALAAALALIGGFVIFGWWPRRLERAALEERISAHQTQLGVDRRGAMGLEEMRRHVAELRDQAAHANKVVPTGSELADVLHRLNAELHGQDMTQVEIQTESMVEGADFNVIPLMLKFTGEFGGVFSVVKSIESMSRLTRINRLEIAGVPTQPAEPVTVRLELTTFSAGEQAR